MGPALGALKSAGLRRLQEEQHRETVLGNEVYGWERLLGSAAESGVDFLIFNESAPKLVLRPCPGIY